MSVPAAVVLRRQEVDDLEAEVSVVAARLNRAHADLVDLTGRVLDGERWAGGGIRSPEHWLVLHAGLSPARAHDVVRLARRAVQLPTTLSAMVAGQLSVDQAVVVARYAPASHEESVGELAPMTTVPQLRRALSRYQFGTETGEAVSGVGADSAGRDERDVPGTEAFAAKAAELSMSYGDGRFLLRYSAPADIGALVELAVREAKDALFTSGQTGATSADGLAEVASRSLATVGSAGSGGRLARYRVYVHLSTDGSWVGGRGAIPASLAAKFACDGVVQPVWEVDGIPVSVGRRQRIVPARTRRLVEDRDRGCVFPGCQARGFLEVHHLDHWADGGATDLDRLVCLCPFHHDAHHRGEFTSTGTATHPDQMLRLDRLGQLTPATATVTATAGLVFTTSRGLLLNPSPGHAARTETPEPVVDAYRGPTGERLHTRWLHLPPNRPALTVVPDIDPYPDISPPAGAGPPGQP